MKLKFKHQAYQADSVRAVVDCFQGQPKASGLKYAIDPGSATPTGFVPLPGTEAEGFANAALAISPATILKNLQEIQREQSLPISQSLKVTDVSRINLDIEMETGTGKTYCYIKTMFELNKQFGWSKFIVVVPSIAIREGVSKSFEVMAEHFLEQYGKRARPFIYNSKQLHQLESFSSDAGINVMIINVQAFATRGEDARRIYLELDDFQSRKPPAM
ncbi:MAG: DEAD/DEAH box helicase family protein [Akkermansiaceae bacterium]